jgi:hypothetical protein
MAKFFVEGIETVTVTRKVRVEVNRKDKKAANVAFLNGGGEVVSVHPEKEEVTARKVLHTCSLKEIKDENKHYQVALGAIMDRVEQFLLEDKNVPLDRQAVTYSAYPTEPQGVPVDNLDDVPIKGKVQIIGENYHSGLLQSPTWLELCFHCNQMIHLSGDYHHIFLEDIRVNKKDKGVKICKFDMGS